MGKSSGGKQEVTQYYLSMQLGLGTGFDAITRILVNEKLAWSGNFTGQGSFQINKPELNGGLKKEGGVAGEVTVLPGATNQVLPAPIAAKFGKTPANAVSFRGVGTIFFTGNGGNGGFYWTANAPFIPPIAVEARRAPVGLDPQYAMIGPDANPIHIIYECLTNTDWGMGAAPYQFDTANWESEALNLFNDDFGISLRWTKQTRIEDFVNEVLDHILAAFSIDPLTGLLKIKVFRDDYNEATLPRFDQTNSQIKAFGRKTWGETVNEIVGTWTNPENGKEETSAIQDIANVVNQGAVISDSRNYYGVRNVDLLNRLIARDLRSASAPLASAELECSREAAYLVAGDVVRVNFPHKQIGNKVMRVMEVDRGTIENPTVKLKLLEDVFALPRAAVIGNPDIPSTATTAPLPVSNPLIFTLPSFLVSREFSRTEVAALTYPETYAGVLAPSEVASSVQLYGQEVLPNGDNVWSDLGAKSVVGRAILSNGIGWEHTTVVNGNPLAEFGRGPEVGGFVVMGTNDADMEIALIESSTGTSFTLRRGVLDTIPKSWPAGTAAYFLPANAIFADPTVRSLGETVSYKLLSRTNGGLLEIDSAPTETATLGARPHLPLRPADVKINGSSFATINATAASELVLTWANRNREFEDGQVIAWDEATVTPEYGQEVVITVFRQNGSEMFVVRGLWTEDTYTIPMAWVEEETRIFVRVQTEMNGLRSLQSFGLFVDLPTVGTPAAPPASPVVVGSQPPPPGPDPLPQPDPPPPPQDYGGFPPTGDPNWNEP